MEYKHTQWLLPKRPEIKERVINYEENMITEDVEDSNKKAFDKYILRF